MFIFSVHTFQHKMTCFTCSINVLSQYGLWKIRYNMLEAKDGKEGLRAILEERPDLVLLDIALPEMDGYQVIKEIKENKEVRDIPVIAMTAHAMKGDREKIIAAGCDDYISKPIDPETVLRKIGEWVGRR